MSTLDLDIVAYLHGDADASTVARLSEGLRTDPALRETFISLARLHGHLGEIGQRAAAGVIDSARLLRAGTERDLAPHPTTRVIRRRRLWGGWVAAAAALLAVGLGVLALGMISLRTRPMLPTIAASADCMILSADGSERPATPGLRLRVGDRIIANGMESSATVTLHGGRFTLGPATQIAILPGDAMKRYIKLESGSIETDLAAADAPLHILTHDADIRITDSHLRIQVEAGMARIKVMRGYVDVNDNGRESRLLEGAESRIRTLDADDGKANPAGDGLPL